MLFNSFDFVLFFAVVLTVSALLPHRPRIYFLLAASYFFYGYWRWQYLWLLLLSTLIDFLVAQRMPSATSDFKRKLLLAISIIVNLSLLGVFKYYNFFADSLASWFGSESIPLDVVLPVGISFYTFQSMSYTIDVYRGKLKPRKNFVDFAVFVAFFPQLVAGPIVRAVDFLPQLRQKLLPDWTKIRSGLGLVMRGYVEKIVIADNLAPIVEKVYGNPQNYSGIDLWIATYCFAFQIFCDFAGYTDIARGVARLLGFDFLENFRRPYLAKNISDFWRRWHISLSTWLRDYLYIPMGGSRHKIYRNLMITMLLGGLWHGANWTFLWWGLYNGLLLALYHVYHQNRPNLPAPSPIRSAFLILLNFHVVCIGWVLFRAVNIEAAMVMLKSMITLSAGAVTLMPFAVLCSLLFAAMAVDEYSAPGRIFERLPVVVRVFILLLVLLSLAVFVPSERIAFIYFQF